MASRGPDTNGSQFFITLRDCSHLNGRHHRFVHELRLVDRLLQGKHVVFGRVVRGYDEVVQKISRVPVDEKDRPTVPVVIDSCGELELQRLIG
jgi:peptidyl-prolyl isomerase G (cyclophilin G)